MRIDILPPSRPKHRLSACAYPGRRVSMMLDLPASSIVRASDGQAVAYFLLDRISALAMAREIIKAAKETT